MRVSAWPAFENRALNPYTWQLYTHLRARGVLVDEFSPRDLLRRRYDIWHLHWPEGALSPASPGAAAAKAAALLEMMEWMRARGGSTLWTVHNLGAHDSRHPALERWFWPAFVRRLDGYIALTESGRDAVQHRHPVLGELPGFVIPHGHYREAYPHGMTRAQARDALGIAPAERVLAFVGQIRPYKNVPRLLEAFRALPDEGSRLLIAGRATDGAASLMRDAAADPRVRLHLGLVHEHDLQHYLLAADLVVLPHAEVLNSGTALLALSFDRPLLAARAAALGELQDQVGDAWVRMYDGALTAETLRDALRWALCTPRSDRAPLGGMDPAATAELTLRAYRSLVAHRARGRLARSHTGGLRAAGEDGP